MEWMLDIQLGRRNLSPIQRIAVNEKYRPFYEKKAKQEQGTRNDLQNSNILKNSSKSNDNLQPVNVRATLAETAGVSTDTYSKGKKILDSDNETLKQEVLSGEKSINAGYKELTESQKRVKTNTEEEENKASSSITPKAATSKTQISEEVK